MNQLLTEYRDMISRRAINNKRKVERIDNVEEESIEVPSATEETEPAESVLQVVNEVEVTSIEIEHQPLEKEKSVAMSSRIMPPLLVYDNGD